MRTTLDIAPEVLQVAKQPARPELRPAGVVLSDLAHHWLKTDINHAWASCPITESCRLRIMSQPGYPGTRP